MSWIDDNKDQGPWEFSEQGDKWGYLNNPRWTSDPGHEGKHSPCGHWHKGDYLASTVTSILLQRGSWWQQTIAYGDDGNVYFAAPNYDFTSVACVKRDAVLGDSIILLAGECAVLTIDSTNFDSTDSEPPTLARCSDYTTVAAFVWLEADGDGFYTNAVVCGVKKDGEDQYWHVAVNKYVDAKASVIGDLAKVSAYFMAALDTGVIVICYGYYNYSVGAYRLSVVRSTDYGVTWSSEIIVDPDKNIGTIKKGDDGELYIVSYSGGAVSVYISTNGGSNWTEKALPALGSPSAYGRVDISVDVNGIIYVAVGRWSIFSMYVSADGGDSWSKYDCSLVSRIVQVEANDTAVIVHGYESATGHYMILKSVDGGVNFTEKVDLADIGFPSITIPSLKHNGQVFIYTYCAMRDANDWLGYLISKDNGDTWAFETLDGMMNAEPVAGTEDGVTTITTTVTAEPQIWNMPS